MEDDKMNLERRKFLAAVKYAGALGAAAIFMPAREVQAASVEAAPAAAPAPSGYHETEHIRRYYACARYF